MSLAVWIVLAPLLGGVAALGMRRWAGFVTLLGAAAGLVVALVALREVDGGARLETKLAGLPGMPVRLVLDPTSALVSTTVAAVATFVLLYAIGYMAEDPEQPRFFATMGCFVAAMQVLVLAGDWLLLLVAWELIGVASYLLIGFWIERAETGPAATRAFVVTRAADLGLYVGVFAVIAATGTSEIAAAAAGLNETAATVAGLGFLLAIIGKSAQAPLQGWLLDAMAGPTPVSALLHAATLVVAGVVLMTRAFPFMPSELLLTIGLVGGVSSVISGVIAVAQGDFKRLLAASTSSQLGLMFLALGAGSVPAALLHLVAHAAMKSALFLGAGIFQHAREGTGFAELGGIGQRHRATFAGVAVAGLALAGVPPLAGFWSKDAIIAATLESSWPVLLVPLAFAGSLLTGVYVVRALRLLWRDDGDAEEEPVAGLVWMGAGLAALATLAAALGFAVDPVGGLLGEHAPEDTVSLALGLIAAGTGLLLGWGMPARRLLGSLHGLAQDGFRLGGGLEGVVVAPVMRLARWSDALDRGIQAGVLVCGRALLQIAHGSSAMDAGLHRGVEGVGRGAVDVAAATRITDERGIDGLIDRLVNGTRRLGGEARQLQTGLVHRELLLAVSGAAVITILLLVL